MLSDERLPASSGVAVTSVTTTADLVAIAVTPLTPPDIDLADLRHHPPLRSPQIGDTPSRIRQPTRRTLSIKQMGNGHEADKAEVNE